MRVALVQERIESWRGGAETSTLEMARNLATLGVDVTVVCASGASREPSADAADLRIHALPVGGGSKAQQTVNFIADTDRFTRLEGFDVVHAITPCFSANVYQPRGGTYVETVRRGVASGRTLWGRAVRWFGRRTNLRQRLLIRVERDLCGGARPPMIAAVSRYVQQQVQEAYGVPDARIRVIFNGVDIAPVDLAAPEMQRYRRENLLGIGAETPLALFAAHNFALKGLRELIEALATPAGRASGLHVMVAGRDNASPYTRRASRLRVAERVHFLGPDAEMRGLYASADVLAHPTWYDPCSRVALEALCCGLPVVTTRWNGAAEALETGRTGFVIDRPDDAPALATALSAAAQPEVRATCRAATPALRDRLSMARHTRELHQLYQEIRR